METERPNLYMCVQSLQEKWPVQHLSLSVEKVFFSSEYSEIFFMTLYQQQSLHLSSAYPLPIFSYLQWLIVAEDNIPSQQRKLKLWLDEHLRNKKSHKWIHICSDRLSESYSDLSSLVP